MITFSGYSEIEGVSAIEPFGEWVKFVDDVGHEIHIAFDVVLALQPCALQVEKDNA
jgi:hypothetical protein